MAPAVPSSLRFILTIVFLTLLGVGIMSPAETSCIHLILTIVFLTQHLAEVGTMTLAVTFCIHTFLTIIFLTLLGVGIMALAVPSSLR